MGYCSDGQKIYQHICCRLLDAVSRSKELLDAGRTQEARELLAQVTAEIGGSIGSSRGQTVCLKESEQTAKEQPPGGVFRRAALHFIQGSLPQAPVRHQQAVLLQQSFCLVQGLRRGHIDGRASHVG